MPRAYNEGLVVCPFYQSSATQSITCEGVNSECELKLLFQSPRQRDIYRRQFCDKDYQACLVSIMLNSKYVDV